MSIDDLYKEPPPPPIHCSFCGKSQHEVRKLIAGPTVFICDECVALCSNLAAPTMVVSQRLVVAASRACRLLAELRWHNRLNDTGKAVWWELELALEEVLVLRSPAAEGGAA